MTLLPDQPEDWWAPGTYEVTPGVHRIPLPLPGDGLRAVNVYVLRDGDRIALIDGGWAMAGNDDRLEAALAPLGFGLGDIRDFYVTHAHRDHYTLATVVRKRFGTQVSLGIHEKPSLDLLTGRDGEPPQFVLLELAGAGEVVAQIRKGPMPKEDPEVWTPPDTWLDDGARVQVGERTLTALHTPGHTQGHLVYHDAAGGVLFAGDHVLPHITPSIGLEAPVARLALGDYLTSLALMKQMPDTILLPAHGPATTSVHERVDQLVEHHRERFGLMKAEVAAGVATAHGVARRIGWTRRLRKLADLDVGNQMLAVLETMAHLDVLAERGELVRTEVDGVAHYAVV